MGDEHALRKWVDKLATSTSGNALKRVGTAAGMAAKKDGQDRVRRVLGGDSAMSNFQRRGRPVPLRLGFDVRSATKVEMNLRPKGVWVLADSGRKRAGFIEPTVEALKIGDQFRSYSAFYPSRGTGVKRSTIIDMSEAAPKAAFKQFRREIGRVVAG